MSMGNTIYKFIASSSFLLVGIINSYYAYKIKSNEKKCPKCNSIDIQGVSRVTGYLSLDERFGPGKFEERADRRSHTGSNMNNYGFI